MTNEQNLLEKWRSLPQEKQQEVIDFVDFLTLRISFTNLSNSTVTQPTETQKPRSNLGIKLQEIREKIVASGVPLLSAEDIELEKAKRRGGFQEAES
ncbi:hypothetical protein PCC7805_04358 (plasmid) [Planktothrix agardhii]|jgi:hypothetical protein|uniref:DUF2281 domain-containing protein n=1 Tax=Planktothrix agardhii TaxID=1160 RepID=A0A1J1JPY4_PLAAG|nr:hypothetical protein [Planktothrix agardhii]BBD57165.1 hypothetical protein NIES204_45010 [Planktothrix agardhii NIES-204]MBG0748612.1 hypothetical protein [Planktothrix agardhii KL2]MCF3578117.1 hypothetical protein [Planktothrix agardhii 1812]MCF3583339.1 hypothetical protein [Planktothrix agardhii 1811]MCF3627448.1 hypothetical protein [Planktothrix agardhii 1801]